jgi:hypothetical protein
MSFSVRIGRSAGGFAADPGLRGLFRLRFVHPFGAATVAALVAAAGLVAPPALAVESAVDQQVASANSMLVEFTLDKQPITDILTIYETPADVFLPLGEISSLLTIGITIDPENRSATGFFGDERNVFSLDSKARQIRYRDTSVSYDEGQVAWIDGELYIARKLLEKALPLQFALNLSALRLDVTSREKLPIQLKLDRTRAAQGLRTPGSAAPAPLYPRVPNDYAFISPPFFDSTVSSEIRTSEGRAEVNLGYSGIFAGDLLKMEANGFLQLNSQNKSVSGRLILGRHDPDGALLGPLKARSVELGDVVLPAVRNVIGSSGGGTGFLVSNRPFDRGSAYGLQTLRGSLPPGWDVSLYINDALIAFQASRADGVYEFQDLDLNFGRTEFTLVFNGPLGQRRVERKSFQLDQALTRPGELFYAFGGKRSGDGSFSQVSQLDIGVAKNLAVTSSLVILEKPAKIFLSSGARASALGFLLNADFTTDFGGGNIIEIGGRTALFGVAINAARTWSNGFAVDAVTDIGSGLKTQDRLNLIGAVRIGAGVKLPVALDLRREISRNGDEALIAQNRISWSLFQSNFTHQISLESRGGSSRVEATLQGERRVAGVSLGAQLGYRVTPSFDLANLAINLNRMLSEQDRLNAGLVYDFRARKYVLTAGLNRRFGKFAVGISGFFRDMKNHGIGITLFTSMGYEAGRKRYVQDWQPMSGAGFASAHAFVDKNDNQKFDVGEEPVSGASFIINGNAAPDVKTDDNGRALIRRLPVRSFANIAIDAASLEDVQWQAGTAGLRVLPRPGKAAILELPVVLTAELDGTVSILGAAGVRPIGNALVEIIDGAGNVVRSTKSASDGYFVVTGIKPGAYKARVSPSQLGKLKLVADRELDVLIPPDGKFPPSIAFKVRPR